MKVNKLLAITAICIAQVSFADDFSSVADRIVDTAPALRSQAAQSEAELLQSATENNLANPEVSFEALFGEFKDNKYNVGLSQGFDWPGLYRARKQRQNAARQLADASLAESQNKLQTEVKSLLAELIIAKRKHALYQSTYAHMESMLEIYSREFERGNVSILDLNKLRIETANLRSSLDEADLAIATVCDNIYAISGDMSQVESAFAVEDLPLMQLDPVDAYLIPALTNSPAILRVRAMQDLGLREVAVAKGEGMPGFMVGYRYSYEDNQNYNGFTFGVTLPAWGSRGRKQAAQATVVAASVEEQSLRATIEANVREQHQTAANLDNRIRNYRQALTATDNIGLLNQAFDAGQIVLTDYITDLRYFVEAELALADMELSLARALIALESFR